MALGDLHDPQIRGTLLRSLLLQIPADGKVDAAAVGSLVETRVRHHLLHVPAGSGEEKDPVKEWFDRLVLLLSSAKVTINRGDFVFRKKWQTK